MASATCEVKRKIENEKITLSMNSKTILSYFDLHREDFQLTWNDANQKDWDIIKKFFIAAYLNAYRNCSIKDDGGIALNPSYISKAEHIIEETCNTAKGKGIEIIDQNIFIPLSAYLNHIEKPLETERAAVVNKIVAKETAKEIAEAHHAAIQRLIKYIALMLYFESMFNEEKEKIIHQHGKKSQYDIQYIIARYHEQPIGFISCNLNYKTSNVYLRWVNISPKFHRLHLGTKMLKAIEKHYNTSGLEVYTREHNEGAKKFYAQYGFIAAKQFWFEEPIKSDENEKLRGTDIKPYVEKWLEGGYIFPPLEDSTSRPDLNVGFIRKNDSRREI